MCAPEKTGTDGVASLRRMALVSLLSIPVAADVIFGEILFVGHIVFLIKTLGFLWALLAFIVIWAVLGIVALAARDFVWPWLGPLLKPLPSRLTSRVGEALGGRGKAMLAALGAPSVLAAAGAAIALAGDEMQDWAAEHRTDLATFFIAAAIILPILLVIARLGRAFHNWVRGIADTADPVMRSLAVLLSMVLLGPPLSWLLFRLLGYSNRSVYALTLVAAPVFGVVWVPFYGLGVWALIEGLL